MRGLFFETEIALESLQYFFCLGSGVWAVVHLNSPAAVFHQCGHGVGISIGIPTRVTVPHEAPLESDVRRQGWQVDSSTTPDVSIYVCFWTFWPLVVVHHLCHGRCHASGDTVAVARDVILAVLNAAIGIFLIVRGLVVVGRALVPCGGKQRPDVHAVACAQRCTELYSLCALRLQPSNLVGVTLQPGTHVGGNVFSVKAAAVAETEDGRGAVVV